MYRRVSILALLVAVWGANAATSRLYLKDGTYHSVREYQKQNDRVRYYSTERGDWEEIPAELVDFDRTEKENRDREANSRKQAADADAEEKAERAQQRELERVPMETGVFRIEGEKVDVLKQAETKVVNNKRRSILKAMSPIPILAGKSTVEIDGTRAAFLLTGDRPEFYIRLAAEERFHIVRVIPTKISRIVQKWNIIPVSKELMEETEIIETFKQQLADGIFKIWPTKPIPPGEYAVVEYTEGKGNITAWDFSLAAASAN